MCRDNRRCPSYSDPALIAARNARRRAAYARKVISETNPSGKKLRKLQERERMAAQESVSLKAEVEKRHLEQFGEAFVEDEKFDTVEKVEATVPTKPTESPIADSPSEIIEEKPKKPSLEELMEKFRNNKPDPTKRNWAVEEILQRSKDKELRFKEDGSPALFNGASFNGESEDQLLRVSHQVVSTDNASNTYTTSNKGSLSGVYFSDKTVRGVIDYQNLAEVDVSKAFGFKEIEEGVEYEAEDFAKVSAEDFKRLSDMETYHLSIDERESLRLYTDEGYNWINKALYENFENLPEENEVDLSGSAVDVIRSTKYSHDNKDFHKNKNAQVAKRLVEEIDKALDRGPKVSRKVYRAVPSNSGFHGGDAKRWVGENLAVGKEIVFDGYQSTTPKLSGLGYWLKDDAVLYEISTPEGLNVSHISSHAYENEVILPRNARYTVVSVNENVDFKNGLIKGTSAPKRVTVVRLVAINDRGEVLDGTTSHDDGKSFGNSSNLSEDEKDYSEQAWSAVSESYESKKNRVETAWDRAAFDEDGKNKFVGLLND